MTVLRRTLAVGLVALAAAIAPTAVADAPMQRGWWWSGNISQLPVAPPPPDVPDGGLYVAGGLAGASGVSALRFALPAGAAAPTLTLQVASSSGTLVLGACRSSTPWDPAEGGAWDARPVPDCEQGAVAAEIVGEGADATATFALAPLVDGEVLDIVLVPGKDPATGTDATFDARFEAPGTDALATGSAPAPSGATPTPRPAASASPTPGGPPAAVSSPVAPPPSPAPFVPAANTSPATVVPEAVNSPPLAATPAVALPDPDVDGRVVGLVIGLLVVAAWLVTTRTGFGTQLDALTGVAGEDVRGIGRFATRRDAPAPPL
jgi:hypothetical protein